MGFITIFIQNNDIENIADSSRDRKHPVETQKSGMNKLVHTAFDMGAYGFLTRV